MAKQARHFYEFGPFRLDAVKGRLLRNGEPVQLTHKAFDTLLVLVEHTGQAVEKEELMEKVWPDTAVEENNLTQCISALRKALGDSRNENRYIVTVPGWGYRFVGTVRERFDESADLLVQEYSRSHVIIKEEEEGTSQGEVKEVSQEKTPRADADFRLGTADSALAGTAAEQKSTAENLLSKSGRQKTGPVVFMTALVAAVALIVFGLYKFIVQNQSKPAEPFQKMRITRLTNTGKARDAAISPDGKYVVYVMEDGGKQSLWVRQVAATNEVQIVPPGEVQYWGLTFSRDGNHVYHVVWERNKADAVLYKLPLLGGASKRITVDIDAPISLSPDGKKFAFVRLASDSSRLMVANADGSEELNLATLKYPEFFPMYPSGPAWSPDGKTIASAAGSFDEGGRYRSVVTVRVEDGAQKWITSQRWAYMGRVAWLSDGRGLVLIARDQPSSANQIWHLSYPGGVARRITNDVNEYDGISLMADSNALVAVQTNAISSIWIVPEGDASQAKQIVSEVGKYEGLEAISWTPDGRLVYRSNASGNADIWIMEPDGRNRKQLTVDAHGNIHPSVSHDGRYVVFASNRAGAFNIWRMDVEGSNPVQLTSGSGEVFPQCSPDGKWVVFQRGYGAGDLTLWKVPIDGGKSRQLTGLTSLRPAISPDGKLLAYYYLDARAKPQWGVRVIPLEGGEPTKRIDIPATSGSKVVRWTPDARALAYIDNRGGFYNIWSQPLEGGPPKQWTDFKSDQIFYFDWSRDGKYLACVRGVETNDVVLLSNFK